MKKSIRDRWCRQLISQSTQPHETARRGQSPFIKNTDWHYTEHLGHEVIKHDEGLTKMQYLTHSWQLMYACCVHLNCWFSHISLKFLRHLEPGTLQKITEWPYREVIANPESTFAFLITTVYFPCSLSWHGPTSFMQTAPVYNRCCIFPSLSSGICSSCC